MDEWEQFTKGIALFNQQEFYDCHDVIEDMWLQESSDEQPFLQGLIQSAVAFHQKTQFLILLTERHQKEP